MIVFYYLACSVALVAAQADDPANAGDNPSTIEVKGLRSPAMLPYKKGYEFAEMVDRVGKGHIEALYRLTSTETKKPIPGLKLTLLGANTDEAIPVDANGLFSMPRSKAAYDDNADFVVNQRKDVLMLDIRLHPKISSDVPTYGQLNEAIDTGRQAIKELLPWYIRVVAPSIKAIGICYPESGRTVTIGTESTVSYTADRREASEFGDPVYCAEIKPQQEALRADSPIVALPGWEARFLTGYF